MWNPEWEREKGGKSERERKEQERKIKGVVQVQVREKERDERLWYGEKSAASGETVAAMQTLNDVRMEEYFILNDDTSYIIDSLNIQAF